MFKAPGHPEMSKMSVSTAASASVISATQLEVDVVFLFVATVAGVWIILAHVGVRMEHCLLCYAGFISNTKK